MPYGANHAQLQIIIAKEPRSRAVRPAHAAFTFAARHSQFAQPNKCALAASQSCQQRSDETIQNFGRGICFADEKWVASLCSRCAAGSLDEAKRNPGQDAPPRLALLALPDACARGHGSGDGGAHCGAALPLPQHNDQPDQEHLALKRQIVRKLGAVLAAEEAAPPDPADGRRVLGEHIGAAEGGDALQRESPGAAAHCAL